MTLSHNLTFISSPFDRRHAYRIWSYLWNWGFTPLRISDWGDRSWPYERKVSLAATSSVGAICVVGPHGLSYEQGWEIATILGRGKPIVPVVLPGIDPRALHSTLEGRTPSFLGQISMGGIRDASIVSRLHYIATPEASQAASRRLSFLAGEAATCKDPAVSRRSIEALRNEFGVDMVGISSPSTTTVARAYEIQALRGIRKMSTPEKLRLPICERYLQSIISGAHVDFADRFEEHASTMLGAGATPLDVLRIFCIGIPTPRLRGFGRLSHLTEDDVLLPELKLAHTRFEAFERLLLDTLSHDECRIFISRIDPILAPLLPSEKVSQECLVFEIVQLLDRRHLVLRALDRLLVERPLRSLDIQSVRELFFPPW